MYPIQHHIDADKNNTGEQKLKREVTVWRSARHTNVVALLGWTSEVVSEDGSSVSSSEGADKIRVSLVSTWCDGGNIKDYLRRNPMADRRALVRCIPSTVRNMPLFLIRLLTHVEDWYTSIPEE